MQWFETVEDGWNVLVDSDEKKIRVLIGLGVDVSEQVVYPIYRERNSNCLLL